MSVRSLIRRRTGYDLEWPTVLLVAITGAVVLTVLVGASTSGAAFGLYNPAWDGSGEFRDAIDSDPDTELLMIEETNAYPTDESAADTVAFVVAPEESYGGEAADRLREFVERGGTLVVLDNLEANANPLLEDVGAEARVDGRLVLDERHNERGPAMPIATADGNHSLVEEIDELALNHATSIEPGNATVLVRTSEFSYLGTSPDDEPDDDANLTRYPVATAEPVGDGHVVVVGDPSVTINAMFAQADNEAFLVGTYDGADRVLLDRSHSSGLPPLIAAVGAIRSILPLQLVLGLCAIGAVAVGINPRFETVRSVIRARIESLGETESATVGVDSVLTEDELAAAVRQAHPDWDQSRIQRVIAAFNRPDSKDGDQ
ncbi:DUF4350 domain-containing protein [Natrarchaeobius oligotrophus]|uniref:DUF4350 domain-containing protein n=1 Tax=Natrarchaeobius chitinivorans TaxID=1679083 RepID=A0A3N6PLG0_NATCH|nr:DUF4350 domain-containing protein [Natrarchaeobius chitinivorans]RQH02270.1 DUF4350 domain-containing protein [Natrarchaeobius chitinivorans]